MTAPPFTPRLGRFCYLALNVAVVVFLLAPIAIVFVFALNPTPYIQFPPVGVSLRWFEKFFASRDFMNALRLSLEVAVMTTIAATLFGASAALALARGGLPGTRVITAIMLSPLMLPAILTGLALFQTYVLLDVGRPLWGLVLGHTLVSIPYVVRTTLAVLQNFDTRLEEAARNLGAGPLRTYFEVTLPLTKPGVMAGAVFAFIVSFDQFPVSLFLVSPGRETLPITLFNYLKFDLDGTIGAASVVSILLAVLVVFGLDRTVGLRSSPSYDCHPHREDHFMTMTRLPLNRRQFLATSAAAGIGMIAAPHVARADTATLRITGWGGKWGQTMSSELIPAFEKEFKCKVETDSAFPFLPKLQASPRSAPVYDVLHTNSNEQWAALEMGIVEANIDAKQVPNIADVYPYAVSDKMVGVCIFTSAIGLGMRTDKGYGKVSSWKELWDRAYDGVRGGYVIPVNSLGQAFLMMSGALFGKGMTDLDAAYAAMEKLKPIKLVDFTGTMEKMILSGEVGLAVIHDSGILRYDGQNQPTTFVAPSEGVLSLEQVLTLTPGTKVRELANAYVNYMLRPNVQKTLAESVWYSPANSKVKLDDKYNEKLLTTPEKVAKLIQPDWKWYNARKDEIDSRVNRIFRA